MRNVTNVQLDDVIFHILDPQSVQGLVLSERALPLVGHERVAEYLAAHIRNSLQDPLAHAASFVAVAPELASGVCADILTGKRLLVEGSRWLAEKLYGLISGDKRIAAGDLGVCLFRDGDAANPTRYLGLLKMDPSPVFRHCTERDEHGRLYVSFEEEPNILPTTRERLQKCAFIRALRSFR